MRTIDEIKNDIRAANRIHDVEALLRLAEELDELGTPQAESSASHARGVASFLRGDYPAALEHDHRALDLYVEHVDLNGVAHVTANIGIVYDSIGDHPAAMEYHNRALTMYEELGDRRGTAQVTCDVSRVHFSTGDYPAALEHLHRALVMFEELGDGDGIARVTSNIALVYARIGNHPMALDFYHRALALHEEAGDSSGVARVTGNLGLLHSKTGNYHEALEHFGRALVLHEKLGERSSVIRTSGNMLRTFIDMGSDHEAQAQLAVMDEMQINEPGVRIIREQDRATLQERSGDLDGSAATLHSALTDAQEHGLRFLIAETHKALRQLALKRNDLAGYVEHNNEFTRISEEINGKDTATKLAMQEAERRMAKERSEHEKHLAVLHSTLPKQVADRVARGETVNDHHENAAVIFLDIVGFTTISDRIPSGQVVHLLEQIFTTLDRVCAKHGVVKIKTIGDSYMAVAFSNTQNQTPKTIHVVSAGLCAVEMLTALNALEITMPPELGDTSWTKDVGDIQVRIGMHCGPVTAGVIGTERMQYDVWGDTVNVASRMESSGEPRRIHVSEAFATALQSENGEQRTENNPSPHPPIPLSLHQRGTIDIKGKGPMATYWLEGTV